METQRFGRLEDVREWKLKGLDRCTRGCIESQSSGGWDGVCIWKRRGREVRRDLEADMYGCAEI